MPEPAASSPRRTLAVLAPRAALHVALPLAIGLFCYAAWRSTELHLVAWMSRVSPGVASALRGAAAARTPDLVVRSLPDFAWAWAFGAALAIIWHGRPWRDKAPWLGGGGAVALFAEIGQAIGVVPGTFDIADLVAIAAGFVLGAWLAGRAPRPVPPARSTS